MRREAQRVLVAVLVVLVEIAMLSPPATAEITRQGGVVITALYTTGGSGGGGGIAITVRGEGDPGFAAHSEPVAASDIFLGCWKAATLMSASGGHRTDRTTLTSASSDIATDSSTVDSTIATTGGRLAKGHGTTITAPAISSAAVTDMSKPLTAPGGRRDKTTIAGGKDENGVAAASPTAVATTSSRRPSEVTTH